jgi:hypothetical protein
MGPLGAELQDADTRRSVHLVHLLTYGRPPYEALQQIRETFLHVAELPLPQAFQDLMTGAAARIVSGVETILRSPDPPCSTTPDF